VLLSYILAGSVICVQSTAGALFLVVERWGHEGGHSHIVQRLWQKELYLHSVIYLCEMHRGSFTFTFRSVVWHRKCFTDTYIECSKKCVRALDADSPNWSRDSMIAFSSDLLEYC
jgi:hypothetical protein